MNLQWECKRFDELSPYQLYAALRLRSEVFVVEQNCIFLDMDDKDAESFHLLGYAGDKLVAYTRIVPPGVIYSQASIGRVVTSPLVRRTGAGKVLMEQSLRTLNNLYGKVSIKIGAQLYLKAFYESFGFVQIGEGYLEDGIPHIHMLREPGDTQVMEK
ncbi:MAG TPA: GNAT family N-acetyltransferase [Flavisolibacter sp.]|jgi:ElaA protein|nr:GNAT family N-acetyltransferase [Flavisolibacter sp.]